MPVLLITGFFILSISYNEFKKAKREALSDVVSCLNLSLGCWASPPCHNMASVIFRALPS